jgi:integration host factor subunit alpha
MGLGKKDISLNISSKSHFSLKDSLSFTNAFIDLIKANINYCKISNFGTFKVSTSPERLGRNPKSGKEYIILKKRRISFKASSNIKNILN